VTTTFREVMTGTLRLAGEAADRPIRLALAVDAPGLVHPLADVAATVRGSVAVPGWADDPRAVGTLRIAPIRARRIRYEVQFVAIDGRRLRLDGWKSIRLDRPFRSMTRLPATVLDAAGTVVGEARLRFDVGRELPRLLASLRYHRRGPDRPDDLLRSRWRGQRGRLEVWYATVTDPDTRTGLWLHHELVSPSDGAPAYAHGWAALFPPDGPPLLNRFGPYAWRMPDAPVAFEAGPVGVSAGRLWGSAGDVSWDLDVTGGGTPLYTFPRWAWHREVLPAAQIVPLPTARLSGTVRIGRSSVGLGNTSGGVAHIYGQGNARRWAWLHADLGDGDVCEVIAAVSHRPGLSRLRALPMVRLRVGGVDLPPGDPLWRARQLRADIDLPRWVVRGTFGDWRLAIDVTQPPEATVAVDYTGPDGRMAVCHNTERGDATIVLGRHTPGGWAVQRRWHLAGTAHAEVGEGD
jgi:hypothetical protein